MANIIRVRDNSASDGVQDVGVQELQGPPEKAVYPQGRGRRLSLAALRFHHSHVSLGRGVTKKCRICKQGLEGILETLEASGPREARVAESDRVDEEGSAAPPPGGRSGRGSNPLLWY